MSNEITVMTSNRALTELSVYHISCVYPCLAMNIDGNSLFWITVQPISVRRCRYQLFYTDRSQHMCSTATEDHKNEMELFVDEFMSEDKVVIQRVQIGLAVQSGNTAPMHEWERTNWEFGHYQVRQLCG